MKRGIILILIIIALILISGCFKQKVNIDQGVYGSSKIRTGNCMPRSCSGIIDCLFGKRASTCKTEYLNTKVIIREPTNFDGLCHKDFESKIVAQTTIKKGFYQLKLEKGNYSLFYEDENSLECCGTRIRDEDVYVNCIRDTVHENCTSECYLKYRGRDVIQTTSTVKLYENCIGSCKICLNETKKLDCIKNITKCEFSFNQNEIKNIGIYIDVASS